MENKIETRLVDHVLFNDGYGYTAWAKYRNFQTWYLVEYWGQKNNIPMSREYLDAEDLFKALDRFDKRHSK